MTACHPNEGRDSAACTQITRSLILAVRLPFAYALVLVALLAAFGGFA